VDGAGGNKLRALHADISAKRRVDDAHPPKKINGWQTDWVARGRQADVVAGD